LAANALMERLGHPEILLSLCSVHYGSVQVTASRQSLTRSAQSPSLSQPRQVAPLEHLAGPWAMPEAIGGMPTQSESVAQYFLR
jgi:hypothetical protein